MLRVDLSRGISKRGLMESAASVRHERFAFCALDERHRKGTLALQTEGQKPDRTWVPGRATSAAVLDNRGGVQNHGKTALITTSEWITTP